MDNLIKSWVWLLGLILITFLSIPGCTKGQSNVEEGNIEGILHWGNGTDPQELDPQWLPVYLNTIFYLLFSRD